MSLSFFFFSLCVGTLTWILVFICLYDAAFCSNFSVGATNSLASCYVRCMKSFFGYSKYSSVTCMSLELGLPSFNTLLHNYRRDCVSDYQEVIMLL